ncbi:MAG: hypothetical protein ABW156_05775 [Jiangellaceae bacterium]
MALQVTQSIGQSGSAPVPITPSASETIGEGSFGSTGVAMRVITTGTATNVSVLDPGVTQVGNPGTVTAVACPATGVRKILIPRSAINANGVATVTFSGALTGVTYELDRW